MNSRKIGNAIMAGLVLVAVAAPVAYADSGPWIRYKQGLGQGHGNGQGHGGQYSYRGQSGHYGREYHSNSGAGPALAGLIGGLIIGSQLNHHVVYEQAYPTTRVIYSAPPPCPYNPYEYYDPYSNRTFDSLDECSRYLDDEDEDNGPVVVEQIDVRTGRCVGTWCWTEGGWHRGHGGNWSH